MSEHEKDVEPPNSENRVEVCLKIPTLDGNFQRRMNLAEYGIDTNIKHTRTEPDLMKSSEYDSDEDMVSSENEPDIFPASENYRTSENNAILKIPKTSNIESLFPSIERNPYLKNLALESDSTFNNSLILNSDPILENGPILENDLRSENYQELKIPTYYNKSEVKPFECGVCSKTFKKVGWLTDHMWTHSTDTPYKCEICQKPVNSSKALKNHMKLHSGDKPFKCDICGKDFRTAGNVQAHVWTHTKDTPFKCSVCGKAVNSKGSLKRHSKIHTNDKQFKCDICNKAFLRSTQLQTHVRIHTGEKPYTCDICGHKFSHSSDMVRHKRVHSDDKPYKCDLCKKSYTTNSSLVTHKRSHSGEKPFVCKICHKTYNRANSLTKHFQRNHEPKSVPDKKGVCGKTFSENTHKPKSKPNENIDGKTFSKMENVRHRKQSNPKPLDVSMKCEFSENSSSNDDPERLIIPINQGLTQNHESFSATIQALKSEIPSCDQTDYIKEPIGYSVTSSRFITDLESKLPLAVIPNTNPEINNRLSGDMNSSSPNMENKLSRLAKNNGSSNMFTNIKEPFFIDESDEASSDDTENYDPDDYGETVDSDEETSNDEGINQV